jgi:hypothetical protein
MSIVDDRGRVAGRANLVDALVAAIVLLLTPLAFGSYLLFRTPPATLTAINPPRLYQGSNLRVEVRGENLRPFMRVTFNAIQGRTFMLGSPRWAMVDLLDLDPGTYDVELFDSMQELSKLPKALTILPLAPVPTVQMDVNGAFTGIPAGMTASFTVGEKFPPNGDAAEVLSVGRLVPAYIRLRAGNDMLRLPLSDQRELPATLRVKCYIKPDPDGTLRCMVPGPVQAAPVAADSVLTLAGPQGWLNFQIESVRLPANVPNAK